jgi:hypothetical protein
VTDPPGLPALCGADDDDDGVDLAPERPGPVRQGAGGPGTWVAAAPSGSVQPSGGTPDGFMKDDSFSIVA